MSGMIFRRFISAVPPGSAIDPGLFFGYHRGNEAGKIWQYHASAEEFSGKEEKMEKLNNEEIKQVSGGIIHQGVDLRCPNCNEDKLQGRSKLDENGQWCVVWYCPRCKKNVITTPGL